MLSVHFPEPILITFHLNDHSFAVVSMLSLFWYIPAFSLMQWFSTDLGSLIQPYATYAYGTSMWCGVAGLSVELAAVMVKIGLIMVKGPDPNNGPASYDDPDFSSVGMNKGVGVVEPVYVPAAFPAAYPAPGAPAAALYYPALTAQAAVSYTPTPYTPAPAPVAQYAAPTPAVPKTFAAPPIDGPVAVYEAPPMK